MGSRGILQETIRMQEKCSELDGKAAEHILTITTDINMTRRERLSGLCA